MTPEQWKKVIDRVSALAPNSPPGDKDFMDELRQLVDPIDESRLDSDNTTRRDSIKAARIAALESELAALKGR